MRHSKHLQAASCKQVELRRLGCEPRGTGLSIREAKRSPEWIHEPHSSEGRPTPNSEPQDSDLLAMHPGISSEQEFQCFLQPEECAPEDRIHYRAPAPRESVHSTAHG